MQRTQRSFYKEHKRRRERCVLFKRMQKNARMLRSFEKNVCPTLFKNLPVFGDCLMNGHSLMKKVYGGGGTVWNWGWNGNIFAKNLQFSVCKTKKKIRSLEIVCNYFAKVRQRTVSSHL